jgi:hypothetical protein
MALGPVKIERCRAQSPPGLGMGLTKFGQAFAGFGDGLGPLASGLGEPLECVAAFGVPCGLTFGERGLRDRAPQ